MLCKSRLERNRPCPFACTGLWLRPLQTPCISAQPYSTGAPSSLQSSVNKRAVWAHYDKEKNVETASRMRISKRSGRRESSRLQSWSTCLYIANFADNFSSSTNLAPFSTSANAYAKPSSSNQQPPKPALPTRSTAPSAFKPAYKPAAAKPTGRSNTALSDVLASRQNMDALKLRIEQERAEQEKERERRAARVLAQRAAEQKAAKRAAEEAERQRRMEEMAIKDAADALERQRLEAERARHLAVKRAEQLRLEAEQARQAEAEKLEREQQHAMELVEAFQSTWSDSDTGGKEALMKTLICSPIALSILQQREPLQYVEFRRFWREQDEIQDEMRRLEDARQAKKAWALRVEREYKQEHGKVGAGLLDFLERQALSYESDKRAGKAQRLDGYTKIQTAFRYHTKLEESTNDALVDLQHFLRYSARSTGEQLESRPAKHVTEEASTEPVEKAAETSDLDRPNPRTSKEEADLKRFTSLQASRLYIDRLQQNWLAALSTHNMRKIINFRRFDLPLEGLLGLPEYKLQHEHRDAEENLLRVYADTRKAVEINPLATVNGTEFTGSLGREAHELLKVLPIDRLTVFESSGTPFVEQLDPRVRRSLEGREALSRVNESLAALRLARRRREASSGDIAPLRIKRFKRLLAEGSLAYQKYFQFTHTLNRHTGFLAILVSRIIVKRGRVTRAFIAKAEGITRNVLKSFGLITDRTYLDALALTQTLCRRLLSSLATLRQSQRTAGFRTVNGEAADSVREVTVTEIKHTYREMSSQLFGMNDVAAARAMEMEKNGSLITEAPQLKDYIAQQIKELEMVQPATSKSARRARRRATRSRNPRGTSHDDEPVGEPPKVPVQSSQSSKESPSRRKRRKRLSERAESGAQIEHVSNHVFSTEVAVNDDWEANRHKTVGAATKRLTRRERVVRRQAIGMPTSTSRAPPRLQGRTSRNPRQVTRPRQPVGDVPKPRSRRKPWLAQSNVLSGNDDTRGDRIHIGERGFHSTPALRQCVKLPVGDGQEGERGHMASTVEVNGADGTVNDATYIISPDAVEEAQRVNREQEVFWQHDLYRAPDGNRPVLHYCKTKAKAETVAQLFLNERVLGFDLEWAPNASRSSPIKDQVSLIQLASEDRIALFQIALHDGSTTGELLAPTLKAIIESPDITKSGVAVRADCTRLQKWLDVKARGVFELSHLYKLVKFGNTMPCLVNKHLISLSTQVLDLFGMHMRKDKVRRSAWNHSLDHTQCVYAATDAYAGYQLYRELERRRLVMRPTPPRPAFVEEDRPIKLALGRAALQKIYPEASELDNPTDDVQDDCLSADDGEIWTAEAEPRMSGTIPGTTEHHAPGFKGRADFRMTPELIEQMEEWFALRSWQTQSEGDGPHAELKPLLASPSQLRAYYMWHVLGMTPKQISLAQTRAIKTATVAMYIAETVRLDNTPYEKARLSEVLEMVPFSQRWRFERFEKILN